MLQITQTSGSYGNIQLAIQAVVLGRKVMNGAAVMRS